MSLAKNIELLRRLPKLPGLKGPGGLARGLTPDSRGPLVEITDFGTNPGELKMFSFVPDGLRATQGLPLVVVLHGCSQTAAGYDLGAGWSKLAKHYGFALLMPEQRSSNNVNGCFNWFSPEDTTRDHGEACSIRQMVARMTHDNRIDKRRIYVTGLSAGGAMTSVMLATYPDVFAGGAVIAGLPFGVASNVRQALSGMFQSPSRPADQLGDLVRNASGHKGPWPKLSVWHGSADRTVNPANADEILKQWLDVHHLPQAPMSESTVNGYPRQVWWDKDGETIIESYTITNMAHGTPLGLADNDERYGAEGAFMIEAGISSSYHIAHFFGLTERLHAAKAAPTESPSAKLIPSVSPISAPLLPSDFTKVRRPKEAPVRDAAPPRSRTVDVSDVITRALTAAGLMK